jgi:ABC-2 type transport system permease protein
MAGNSELRAVKDQGWLQGFSNLARCEFAAWWKTRIWLGQILIWTAILCGMLAMVILAAPNIDESQNPGKNTPMKSEDLKELGLQVLFIFGAMAPAVGSMIFGQESILEEKQTGTAGWILSKPISRSAFVLSKVVANAVGILVTMVIAPGIGAYIIFRIAGVELSPIHLGAAMGLLYITFLFYLALATLLGTLFNARGPVIGICLGLIFGYQIFLQVAPWLSNITPWGLTFSMDSQVLAQTVALAKGQPLTNLLPLAATLAWTVLFVILAIWRFNREEL